MARILGFLSPLCWAFLVLILDIKQVASTGKTTKLDGCGMANPKMPGSYRHYFQPDGKELIIEMKDNNCRFDIVSQESEQFFFALQSTTLKVVAPSEMVVTIELLWSDIPFSKSGWEYSRCTKKWIKYTQCPDSSLKLYNEKLRHDRTWCGRMLPINRKEYT